jgi:putative restriction endonuclease
VGEPFFFKTHAPHNRVVGGGFFSGYAAMAVSEAWETYGAANGVSSAGQMLRRIAHYRREPIAVGEDPVIGCVFIRDVTFFPDPLAHDPPPGFKLSTVQGKGYDLAEPEVAGYFGGVTASAQRNGLGGPCQVMARESRARVTATNRRER